MVALLGDKVQEKVLDILAKVDKSVKLDGELAGRRNESECHPLRRQPAAKRPRRCYYCGDLGHVQFRCFKKQRDEARDRPPMSIKRPRRDEGRMQTRFLPVTDSGVKFCIFRR